MKRAGMLLASVWIAMVIAVGCNSDQFGSIWPSSGQAGKQADSTRVASEPIPAMPPASAPADEAEQAPAPGDPVTTAVSRRVEEYLTRLRREAESAAAGESSSPGRHQKSGVPESAPSTMVTSPTTRPAAESLRPSTTKPAPGKTIERTTPPPKPPALATTTRPASPANAAVAIDEQPPGPSRPGPMATVMAAPARSPRVELVDVRPAIRPAQPTVSVQPTAPPNQPTTTGGSAPVSMDTAAMISHLEEVVAKHPEQLDDQLKLRLLYLATGQDEKAVAPLNIGDPVRAEFLTALLKTLRNSKNMIVDPASKDPSALAAVDELRRLLGQQLPVSIPRIALVTRINSFGDYQALNPPRFPAGKPIQVYLYTEVSNFRSEPTDEGKVNTVLSQKVEIFDSTGKIIWQRSEPSIVDRVVTPRRDFFIPFPISLPGDLAAGEYILKVTIEDKLGATADQEKLTFTVGQ